MNYGPLIYFKKSLTEQELNTFVICANYSIGTTLHNFVWKNIYLIDTMDSGGLDNKLFPS